MPDSPIELSSGRRVSATRYAAEPGASASLILAHGAGAGHKHPFMVRFARGLASRGIDVVTFNFPYMEERRRAPDPGPVLEGCFEEVIRTTAAGGASRAPLLAIGGKSMGGRIASQLIARASPREVGALVFVGYPLHPPGRPTERRDKHLPRITIPMLFVQGSRDAFGTPAELEPVLANLPNARLAVVEGGDHSLSVSKRSAKTQEEVYDFVLDTIAEWLRMTSSARLLAGLQSPQ